MAQRIKASRTYLYRLDPQGVSNLWGGLLQPQNGYDQSHLNKDLKLILNAEDLLKGAVKLLEAASPQMTHRNAKEREAYALLRKAVENINN